MRAVPRVIWLLSSKALVHGNVRWKRAVLPKTALGAKSRSARCVFALHKANLRLLMLTHISFQRNTKLAIFFMPSIFLYLMFATLTILPWYTGVILAMAEFFGMHHVCLLLPHVCQHSNFPSDCHPRSVK